MCLFSSSMHAPRRIFSAAHARKRPHITGSDVTHPDPAIRAASTRSLPQEPETQLEVLSPRTREPLASRPPVRPHHPHPHPLVAGLLPSMFCLLYLPLNLRSVQVLAPTNLLFIPAFRRGTTISAEHRRSRPRPESHQAPDSV
ncbi:hypothetical protein K466DRAFT_580770 [Polyporus arcularius HHB13444]|uniref:Uncharacterized protein n=1 Tax=Polyporus arcularius HHB13444 TaxID=1314778 RepID=A0A5C3PVT8_9APHY|nr:hypothetical protein K466DRAFT_580770 [Polyporus arcularius HHB13444]